MAKSEKWNPEDYKYCEKHDQHYKQYCSGCALNLGEIEVEEYARIDIVKGVEGHAIYINDFRVVGPKPWGGGEYIKSWEKVKVEDILKAIGKKESK